MDGKLWPEIPPAHLVPKRHLGDFSSTRGNKTKGSFTILDGEEINKVLMWLIGSMGSEKRRMRIPSEFEMNSFATDEEICSSGTLLHLFRLRLNTIKTSLFLSLVCQFCGREFQLLYVSWKFMSFLWNANLAKSTTTTTNEKYVKEATQLRCTRFSDSGYNLSVPSFLVLSWTWIKRISGRSKHVTNLHALNILVLHPRPSRERW